MKGQRMNLRLSYELNPSCEEIYFYRGNGGYELVLRKDFGWKLSEK